MADSKSTLYSDLLRGISGILSLFLPILQIFQPFLQQGTLNIFVGTKESFFITTIITFFLSIFVLLLVKANPYISFVVNKKQQAKYGAYLQKTDPRYVKPDQISKVQAVEPPYAITTQSLVFYSIGVFIVSGFLFLYLGLVPNANTKILIQIIDPIVYMFMIVSAVFILSALATQLNDRELWKTSRQERINKAINLAKEHDGFINFPPIKFQSSKELFYDGPKLIVDVLVGGDPYTIVTDSNAEILISVSKTPSASASASKPLV